MGWWSNDIMGGDTPLDFEDSMYELQGIEKFPEHLEGSAPLSPDGFTDEVISDYLKKAQNWGLDIGLQVLGHMIMEAGAPMSEDVKKAVLLGCSNDEWAQEDDERRAVVAEFSEKVARYDSSGPVSLERKGLLDVIAEKLG